MSGTSTDGVDVAAIELNLQTRGMKFLGVFSSSFLPDLRNTLLLLQQIPPAFPPATDPIALLLQARKQLTEVYADAVNGLLAALSLKPMNIEVLGAHGQTLRHRPDLGYTYQMLDGALLASRVGIDVVCDLRSKDVALGGQGAPLVPSFHQAWLNGKGIFDQTAVLNLGGFSNLTVLNGPAQPVTGGDCGPANCLMDLWAQQAFSLPMDMNGEIASKGQVDNRLLAQFWQHAFFAQQWPKSTGRDEFGVQWFDHCLQASGLVSPADVMATLLALAVKAIQSTLPACVEQVFLCGGGAKNSALVAQLRRECAPTVFLPIEHLDLPTQAVEAAAFAWLAVQHVLSSTGNCPSVTGASRATILGAMHRAN